VVMKGPVRNEATSVASHLHTAQHPFNDHSNIGDTPAVPPVLPILPPINCNCMFYTVQLDGYGYGCFIVSIKFALLKL